MTAAAAHVASASYDVCGVAKEKLDALVLAQPKAAPVAPAPLLQRPEKRLRLLEKANVALAGSAGPSLNSSSTPGAARTSEAEAAPFRMGAAWAEVFATLQAACCSESQQEPTSGTQSCLAGAATAGDASGGRAAEFAEGLQDLRHQSCRLRSELLIVRSACEQLLLAAHREALQAHLRAMREAASVGMPAEMAQTARGKFEEVVAAMALETRTNCEGAVGGVNISIGLPQPGVQVPR